MKTFEEFKKEVEKHSKVISAELSENLLTINTRVPFDDSDELMVLYVVKSVKGNYLLTDLGHLIEILYCKGKEVDKIQINLGLTNLKFDEENIYAKVLVENINVMIDEFIKFILLMSI